MTTTEKMGIQNLRDTSSNLSTKQTVLKAGELFYETDTDRVKMGNGSTKGSLRPHFLDSEKEAYIARLDGLYEGVDLTTKFASEISASPYSGNAWAWIKARIQANNFKGIHVGDYIPVSQSAKTITDGSTTYNLPAKTLNAQIAGIDTYYGCGDQEIGHHIDFITKETIGVNIPYNKSDHNNGTSTINNPFMASKIYACLNGIDNTGTGYDSTAYGYDASSSGGVLQALPEALRNVIIGKRVYAETRYSASGHLTSANNAAWVTMGGLWLPTEQEVFGMCMHSGGVKEANSGVDRALAGTPVQYPIFAGTAGKRANNKIKNRTYWWLASVPSGSSSHACFVTYTGFAAASGCTDTYVSVPVCFRVG